MRLLRHQGFAALLAALPALALVIGFLLNGLGANPVEDITHTTGEWALRLLLLSLTITPLRRIFGLTGLAPLRRTLGLAGFAYAAVHLLTWLALDVAFEPEAILDDLSERSYIMAGMGAFLLLVPLALTSTRASIQRLGRRWIHLHRCVYAAAALGVLHHFWLTKADYRPPLVHGSLLALLMTVRLVGRLRRRASFP